jgi:hypothetical protein
MVNALTSSAVDRGFAKHTALRRKNRGWLARNRDNVSEWGDMSTPGHSLFIVYMFFYVLKELRHLINDIKLDTVLTINKPLTKTSRAVARGKV